MSSSTLLFGANFMTWAEIIGAVIVATIYVFNHLITVAGKQQRRPARPEVRPEQRGPRPAGGKPVVQDEVAEFLKRAAEKRSTTKTAEGRPAQERVDPRIVEMRAAAQKRQSANRSAAPAEIVEARTVEPLTPSRWPGPVHSHVDTRDLAERAGQLMQVDRADAAFQAHIQSLDHQVGRINESDAGQPSTPADAGPQTIVAPPNEVFAALLSDPQSLRQAIILNEIIERPVERW
jgi:hypothetical protein